MDSTLRSFRSHKKDGWMLALLKIQVSWLMHFRLRCAVINSCPFSRFLRGNRIDSSVGRAWGGGGTLLYYSITYYIDMILKYLYIHKYVVVDKHGDLFCVKLLTLPVAIDAASRCMKAGRGWCYPPVCTEIDNRGGKKKASRSRRLSLPRAVFSGNKSSYYLLGTFVRFRIYDVNTE